MELKPDLKKKLDQLGQLTKQSPEEILAQAIDRELQLAEQKSELGFEPGDQSISLQITVEGYEGDVYADEPYLAGSRGLKIY